MGTATASWICTYSGRKFDPFHIDPDQIVIEDIAHALSNICRYTGHCAYFYSVAEHSVGVSHRCHPDDALAGLLHDASEAYLMDLARPIKHHPDMQAYRDVEASLQAAVYTKFGLDPAVPASVHTADNRILISEANQLMPDTSEWNWPVPPYDDFVAVGHSPHRAEDMFLQRFEQLTAQSK